MNSPTSSPGLGTGESSGELEQEFIVWHYLRILLERKWAILVFMTLIVVGVVAWTLRQTPIYRATATVQVDLQAPSVLGREVEQVEELGGGSFWSNQEYLHTQYKIIKSREVVGRVVDKLHLDLDPDFAGPPEDDATKVEVMQAFTERIVVEPVRDSRLIKISVDDSDPERARTLANAVTDAFLEQNVERMLSATVSAVEWLNRQLTELDSELHNSEEALYAFRRDKGILSVSLEDRQNITSNQIRELSDTVTRAEAGRIELSSRVAEIEGILKMDPLDMPLNRYTDSNLIPTLKHRHSELSQEREALSKTYGKNWRRVQEIDQELEEIGDALSREARTVYEAAQSEYRAARRTEAGLRAALEKSQNAALELNQYEIEYNRLRRDQENDEKLYKLVLGRATETDLAKLLKVNNLRVLDYAITPDNPIKPTVVINVLVGLVIGLIGGITLAFLLEFMDLTIKSQADLERFGIPVLGLIPSIERAMNRRTARAKHKGNGAGRPTKKELFVFEHPKSVVAESSRSIRTNLMFMSTQKELRSLLVTSPAPREGKTTVTVTLATVLAQGGSSVVIVDTDMRRSRLAQVFGVDESVGASSVIVGQASLDVAVQPTGVDGVWILPCGPRPPNPAELLQTAQFEQMLSELIERFDRVILDSPPVGAVTDAAILGRMVDGVVVVAMAGKTRKEGARRTVQSLGKLGSRVLGVIVNDVDIDRRDYGYYNYYYRRRGRDYYYGYGGEEDEMVNGSNDQPSAPAGHG